MGNWKTDYISARFSPDEIPVMREEYAKLLAIHNRSAESAFVDPRMDVIFKRDVSAKLYAKANWAFDTDILDRVERYLTKSVDEILPSKEQVAKMILDIANETHNGRDKLAALREYSILMGFDATDVSGNTTNNVILITDNGDELTWEERMKRQQHNLQERAERMLDNV